MTTAILCMMLSIRSVDDYGHLVHDALCQVSG